MSTKADSLFNGTPVNILWDDILMIPIYGIIDTARAQNIMETMLSNIQETSARVIILDILGVATVDTAVAGHIINITHATRLMGCKCIISGVSPAIAQTIVKLNISLGDVLTTSTLRDAFRLALDMVGHKVVSAEA